VGYSMLGKSVRRSRSRSSSENPGSISLMRVGTAEQSAGVGDMASAGPLTNGYTRLPNIVVDELIERLSGSETKVLLYVIRHTIGFNRTNVKVGIPSISRRTKLHTTTVAVALGTLREKGLLAFGPPRSGVPTCYALGVYLSGNSGEAKIEQGAIDLSRNSGEAPKDSSGGNLSGFYETDLSGRSASNLSGFHDPFKDRSKETSKSSSTVVTEEKHPEATAATLSHDRFRESLRRHRNSLGASHPLPDRDIAAQIVGLGFRDIDEFNECLRQTRPAEKSYGYYVTACRNWLDGRRADEASIEPSNVATFSSVPFEAFNQELELNESHPEPRTLAGPNCQHCGDTGQLEGVPCPQCRAGERFRDRLEAPRRDDQSRRWSVFYDQARALGENALFQSMSFRPLGATFSRADLEEREKILADISARLNMPPQSEGCGNTSTVGVQ
jgi:phage replication O-like protein O